MKQYRRRYLDEDDDHILQDGEIGVVPMSMRDSLTPLQRAVAQRGLELHDGHGGTSTLGHRPGFITSNNLAMHDAKQEAYDAYERELTSAWRGGPAARDAGEGAEGSACMVTNWAHRDHFGSPGHIVNGICVPDELQRDARVTQRDPRGRVMSTWQEEDDEEQTRDGMTLDELQRAHQHRMACEYEAYDHWIKQQWRNP